MPLLSRLGNVSTINRFLRYSNWISSPGKKLVSLSKSTFQKPGRLTKERKVKLSSVHFCNRNSSFNRSGQRVAKFVNKRVMSSANTSSRSTSGSPNGESDDISLTFWIFLWSILAITASWIYTKLNTETHADEDDNLHGQQEDEQIARKLVKEITKNDPVKRSTFRRQRSYEIIDGEVRIYYDVAYEEPPSKEKEDYGKKIIDSAEVDSFPIRRSSMEEMELIFPGNLPRIIEEGEEEVEDECEEAVKPPQVTRMTSDETRQMSEDKNNLQAVKVVDYDCEMSNSLNSGDDVGKEQEFIEPVFVESNFDSVLSNGIIQPQEAEQTNEAGLTKGKTNEGFYRHEGTKTAHSFLSNSDNSSSDKITSAAQENLIENSQQNAQVRHLSDTEVSVHTSNSTPALVYKLTEVTPRDANSFTVTRREIRRPNSWSSGETLLENTTGCFQAQPLPSHTLQEPSLEYVKQSEMKSPPGCEVVKGDICCHNGREETNLHSDINKAGVLKSTCNVGQDVKIVSGQQAEVNFPKEEGNQPENNQGNVQETEVEKQYLPTDRKSLNQTSLDQVGKVAGDEIKNLDCEHDGFCNGEIKCNISENLEEESYNLRPIEDGSDIFVDNSGDFLFKVIAPSEVELLEDIEEGDEYVENVGDHFPIDENSNYKVLKSEAELSKNWKSLPSWEDAHHIHHREVDSDVDDFNLESENVGGENEPDEKGIQTLKSQENISSMVDTISKCEEVFEESNELNLVIEAVADSSEHVSLKKNADATNGAAFAFEILNTSEVILAETTKNDKVCAAQSGPMLTHNKETSNNISNTMQVAITSNNIDDPEEVIVLKAMVLNEEEAPPIYSNVTEHNLDKELTDTNTQIFTEAASMEDDAARMEDDAATNAACQVKKVNQNDGTSSAIAQMENDDEDSDEEIIVACISENNEELSGSKIIYAKEKVSSPTYHVAKVLSHESYETKKFQETSLDSVPLISSPITHLKEQLVKNEEVFFQGTDVDSMSDVDEIDIDDIEPEERYKSKSVTDLDQALASYSSSDYNACDGMTDNNTSYCGLSKSVPDIVDSCREESLIEAAVKTNSNNSIDSLTENVPKKNLSISTPEIGALQSQKRSKKVTKIKIVHVKFLEMQDGSGSENIEEDSFTVEGDVIMSGKMKRRSRNFSNDSNLPTDTSKSLNQETVNECFIAEKVQQKQLEFGFDELFEGFPSSPSSAQTTPRNVTQRQPSSSLILPDQTTHSYSKSQPEKERFIAKYGVIQAHASTGRPPYSGHSSQGVKLAEKFQMTQDSTQHNKKSSSYQSKTEFKHSNESRKSSKTKTFSHRGHLVTVKSSIVNDYECSSDADSEMSYNTPSPRLRTRKNHRVLVHSNSIESASSSDADSPRRRERMKAEKPTMSQIFGIQNDKNLEHVKEEEERMSERNPKLFSRFGHFQQRDLQMDEESCSRQQEWTRQRNMTPAAYHYQRNEVMLDEAIPNRSMEFNPFTEAAGYHGFEPFERNHSPTSISSDQTSVFSFNCDFEPMPAPTSSFCPDVYSCENPMCRKQDILLGPEKTSYKSCPACFTYYCTSECRKLHWPAHKQSCYFGRVNTYVRSIIRLCQRRQDLSMYLSQLARDGYNKKGRGVVMATFNSPELAREFITKGHDAFSGRKPTYSSLSELNQEGVISKHRVALMQAVRDYEPNDEFVFNIAVVAVQDIPAEPPSRYKLNTVLHCIKMSLNEKIVTHQPKEYGKVETRLFALPKCSRHEFVNEMEARRHYCRNLSKNLRQYNIKLKEDYEECYKKLCMYVEHEIAFEPMTVYGQRGGLTYKCIIAPEQNYPLNQEYC